MTSTRGIKISSTSKSLNSIAERISSPPCLSKPPSLSTSSTMVISSSSVIPPDGCKRNTFFRSFFHCLNIQLIGHKIIMKNFKIGAIAIEILSAFSLAILLGEISPNNSTKTVITIVAMVTPLFPIKRVNNTVAKEEERILAILLPTRIVDNNSS